MEVEPSSFDTDPEGQALAAAINASLPPEVGLRMAQGEARGALVESKHMICVCGELQWQAALCGMLVFCKP